LFLDIARELKPKADAFHTGLSARLFIITLVSDAVFYKHHIILQLNEQFFSYFKQNAQLPIPL